MQILDAIGFIAAGFVFLTFCMKSMTALRMVAVASNLCFLVYGSFEGLPPVVVLHGALLPLNIVRLSQAAEAESFPCATFKRQKDDAVTPTR